jgi:hypothetical protein
MRLRQKSVMFSVASRIWSIRHLRLYITGGRVSSVRCTARVLLTGSQDRSEDWELIYQKSDSVESFLVEVDDILEQCLEVVESVVVFETFVAAEKEQDALTASKVRLVRAQCGGALLLKCEVAGLAGFSSGSQALCQTSSE